MREISVMILFIIILALAVTAQSTTGNQSSSQKTDQQKLKEFDQHSQVYDVFNNQVKIIDIKLKNPALTPEEKLILEEQKKGFEKSRDSEYEKLKNSRNQVMFIAKNPATSKKMVENAQTNFKAAEKNHKDNPANPLFQIEYQRSVQELALAKEFDKQVNTNIQPCSSAWACVKGVMSAYDEYKGIGQITHLAWPEYSEWSKGLRKTISNTFCGFVSIQNCFESVICGAVLDISSGNAIAGNVLFGRGPSGQPLTAGTISAERSLPVTIKGMENQQLIDMFNSEIILIGKEVINLSETDTTKLPAQEVRLYRIQYTITNSNTDKELKFNIQLKGNVNRQFYSTDKKLKPGETDKKTIEALSTNKIDEVCLTFDPSLPAGTGSTLIVAPKMVNKLCKPVAEYAGGPTTAGNYAKETQQAQSQGKPPEGFI